jgi:hypothetical protein
MRYLSYTEHDPVMAFGAGFPPDCHTQNVSNEPMTLGLPSSRLCLILFYFVLGPALYVYMLHQSLEKAVSWS